MNVSVAVFEMAPGCRRDLLQADISADEESVYRALGQRRADQYLASRWLLRQHLAAELGGMPAEMDIAYAANAAPRLVDRPLRMGLSHSGALCMSVLSTHAAAGCDAERIRPRRHTPVEIAQLYFAPREAQALAARADDAQLADFYRLWTLKEATLKACERGISYGLGKIAFDPDADWACIGAPDAGAWTFAAGEFSGVFERFALALAVRAARAKFTAWQFELHAGRASRRKLPVAWHVTSSAQRGP